MTSLLNPHRPPFFCPGCSHERVVKSLDKCFQELGLAGNQIAIVTDIGCSGLFDTFFNTHALHGLHGRALTYATGLKLACPSLTVVVIMGDGGLGIGGAHVLSACRRNLDISLLVLNNFNYGMTGGQCSATTPVEATTSSGFLGQLEAPLDICAVAGAAGASWIDRVSATDSRLSETISQALTYNGFSLMDITGICPGRFSKRNKRSRKLVSSSMGNFEKRSKPDPGRVRPEYGQAYRQRTKEARPASPMRPIAASSTPAASEPVGILFLGAAGQRVNTAAEILCLSAMHGGLYATLKNDYPITVLRGHSISEVIVSSRKIGFTGIGEPDIIVALADEGVERRKNTIRQAKADCLIVREAEVALPETEARVITFDSDALYYFQGSFLIRYQACYDHPSAVHKCLQSDLRGQAGCIQCSAISNTAGQYPIFKVCILYRR